MQRTVTSVHSALDILEMFAEGSQELGVSEVAQRLGLAKASVFRHLKTLTERGYLEQRAQSGRYHLSARFFLMARTAPKKFDLVTTSKDIMETLCSNLRRNIVLSSISEKGPLVLTTIRAPIPVEVVVRSGASLPPATSAQGRVALAFGPPALWKYVSKRDRQSLVADMKVIKARGWASNVGSKWAGITSIAVPIFKTENTLLGTLAAVGPQQSKAPGESTQISALRNAAEQISQRVALQD